MNECCFTYSFSFSNNVFLLQIVILQAVVMLYEDYMKLPSSFEDKPVSNTVQSHEGLQWLMFESVSSFQLNPKRFIISTITLLNSIVLLVSASQIA